MQGRYLGGGAAGFTSLPTQSDVSNVPAAQRGSTQGDLNGLPGCQQRKRFDLNSLSANITNSLHNNHTKCGFLASRPQSSYLRRTQLWIKQLYPPEKRCPGAPWGRSSPCATLQTLLIPKGASGAPPGGGSRQQPPGEPMLSAHQQVPGVPLSRPVTAASPGISSEMSLVRTSSMRPHIWKELDDASPCQLSSFRFVHTWKRRAA